MATRNLPVLIIPGFMSSGLTIQKSPHKSWEGKRLWLNISSAGFNSLHTRGALRKNEKRRSTRDLRDASIKSSEEMHQEYLKQMECKSKWVWHMRLQPDMINEKEGVEVRPVPGTAGVDYLAPGALTESMSYVFGPVLKLLKAKGYIEGVDLDAAPYDWRIHPGQLQSRDRYFSNTIAKIENLYRKSNNTPVVLLCHSMGCKTGHYLLNFVLHRLGKADGQAWLDRHIHSYVPVGAPHLGAQKCIRAMIDGDRMGLDAFLEKEEGLMLGRSLGSAPWLFPLESFDGATPPKSEALPQSPPLPVVVVRQESAIRISIPAQCLQLKSFVHNRKRLPPSKLRLAVQIGNDLMLRTNFVKVTKVGQSRSSLQVNFPEGSWLVACPATIEQTLNYFPFVQLHLEEPGTGSTAPKPHLGLSHFDVLWVFRCAFCILSWIVCCPCSAMWKLGCCFASGARRGADFGAALVGGVRVIGQSNRVDWRKGILGSIKRGSNDGGEGGQDASIMYDEIYINTAENVRFGFWLTKPLPERFRISVKWEPNKLPSAASTVVCHGSDKDAAKRRRFLRKKYEISYDSCINSNQLLQLEGMKTALNLQREVYGNDPIGPTSLSSWHSPPVKKVVAIYGINLDTEVGCAYQRNPCVQISTSDKCHTLEPVFILDEEASLNKNGSNTHVIEDGVICETKNTPQEMIGGGTERRSGDGTVPYWSLQHCRAWRGKCDVVIHEIDGAEHRAILNDKRFHNILLDLLGVAKPQGGDAAVDATAPAVVTAVSSFLEPIQSTIESNE